MDEDELSDEFLIDAIAGRAMWALERLHQRYSGRFYALAYRISADHMAAEELVQDTFFAIWQSASTYSPQAGPVRGWLFSIIYYRTIDYLRSARRRSTLLQVPWQEVEAYERFALSDVWEQAWTSVQNAELHTCLMQLPTEQRTVIELAFFAGWTQGEIAQRCKMPLGTVKARMRLGVLHLRRALEQRGVSEETSSVITKRETTSPVRAVAVVVQATESGCATGYELCINGSCGCFGYTEWEHLVEQIDTFEFRGTAGSFIA
ncbi:MAG TPA: sigma-70 family RNA polymerase sigma factor, partial [Ktedonobacteraceae bacterium]